MIESVPSYERKSNVFVSIFNSESKQFELLKSSIDDIRKQLVVDTATWGLRIYEKDLKIQTDLNKSIDERRSVIKSKMRGQGNVGASLIKLVVDAYTNGNVEVSFNGKINITFMSIRGVPPNLNDVYKSVEEIKPAHLDAVYVFTYTTWDRFDSFNYTWDAIDALNKTWNEIEVL